ncbi:1,4-dihydroxy-2-naphthoate polyprenyltransferase [Salinarchaeum laminariae]|uniref:1,4-dihydroxy-2-naphthoate polyprenyltransferase n=1 Tax=Salinarchaeum laminariae TaxID=869888 RepID=UPI0020BE1E07|nr:1,4-dihydroxy-2-naphthoate polyprenyltransferase [Salinarchaeum laminariae]
MSGEPSRARAWVLATRPQTLPAGAAPVIVGTAVAVHEGVFAPLPALAALVGALLIQIGTNFANDYYDAVSGVDSADREGFTRATNAGLIPPEQVKIAAFGTFGLAIVLGIYLVYVGGLPIVVIGLASVVSGYAYAGGPALGSKGLGDLFVFVFFGVVAVTGTTYVQAAATLANPPIVSPPGGAILPEAVVASLAMAGLSTTILVINNVRDLETDREAGKRTLAVMIGYRWSRVEFFAMMALAYLVPPVLWLGFGYPIGVLVPLVTLPLGVALTQIVRTRTDGEALNPALERTGQLLFVYAVTFAFGVVV